MWGENLWICGSFTKRPVKYTQNDQKYGDTIAGGAICLQLCAECGNGCMKQIVNDRSQRSEACNRAWQLTVEQLSTSSKTLTLSYTTH